MKTIFELTVPRSEVLHGDLREDMFAARLRDVMERTADEVYKTPQRFFENTFPTEGLKTLLREVLGRLTGQAPTPPSPTPSTSKFAATNPRNSKTSSTT